MRNLVRLIYISRSTSDINDTLEFEPGIALILARSRVNNRQNGLGGVLYFGNGCFFQCLEGPAEKVDALYQKLHQDPRHKDLKMLSRQKIERPAFAKWDMKYVKLDAQINNFLTSRGYTKFDPYAMDDKTTEDLIRFLKLAPPADQEEPADDASVLLAPSQERMIRFAVSLSMLSLLVSLGALAVTLKIL